LSGGTYTVIVTDACGCTQTGSFTVQEPEAVGAYFGAIIPLLDGTYFVHVVPYGGVAPYQFRRSTPVGYTDWGPGNGFLGVPPGDYTFEVMDARGCTAQAAVTLSSDGNRPENDPATEPVAERATLTAATAMAVSLFPNPTAGSFTVELSEPTPAGTTLYATNLAGQVLLEKQLDSGAERQTVEAGALPPGIYFLQVMVEGSVVAVEKLIRE
jgi:hypothetical protein